MALQIRRTKKVVAFEGGEGVFGEKSLLRRT